MGTHGWVLGVVALLCIAVSAAAPAADGEGEDTSPIEPAFREGDVIQLENLDQIRDFVPPEFWANREFFFYEGMQLEIGPFHRDYSPAQVYQDATETFRGQARIGPENSLTGYTAGQPFPVDEIDCLGDPQAGAKYAWDFAYRWEGAGGRASFYYSYWDRGEELPLYYEGTAMGAKLSHRPEPSYLEKGGVVPQYQWQCLGEMDLLAPVNSRVKAYPFNRDHNFGPYGLSFADDRWELRHAVKIRFLPNSADHPYHHKDIYIDKQSLEPLYSFAYDQKQDLWKVIWHNHRWSDDSGFREYAPWDEVESPRDLTVVCDSIANVQTGTGNRIEFWNRSGTPMKSLGRIRRFIDVGRLTRGR